MQLDQFRKMQADRLEADRKKKEELGWVSLGFISDLLEGGGRAWNLWRNNSTEIAINIMGKNIRPLMYELPRDFLLA